MWVEAVLAGVEWRYLRAVAARSWFVCVDQDGCALTVEALTTTLGGLRQGGRPVSVVYWIGDGLGVALVPLVAPGFRRFVENLCFLYDDTVGGRVSARFQRHLGGRQTVLARRDDPARLTQLRTIVAERGSVAFAVDGGGPYRRVGTGLVAMSELLGAPIVPIAVRASRAVAITPRSGVLLPLPGSRLALAIGEAVAADRRVLRRQVADQVRRALDTLGGVAERAARGRIGPAAEPERAPRGAAHG